MYETLALISIIISLVSIHLLCGVSAIIVINRGDLSEYISNYDMIYEIILWPYILHKRGY